MSTHNDGGAAFPTGLKGDVVFPGGFYTGAHVPEYKPTHAGMSLRDWFAGQALAGMSQVCGWQGGDFVRMAKYAYEAADAMLKAREVSP